MTYQGARARPAQSEDQKTFAVSAVRLDNSGHVAEVRWNEVGANSEHAASGEFAVPVSDVVDAIHDGATVVAIFPAPSGHFSETRFEVMMHPDGHETIALVKPSGPQVAQPPDLSSMARIEGAHK